MSVHVRIITVYIMNVLFTVTNMPPNLHGLVITGEHLLSKAHRVNCSQGSQMTKMKNICQGLSESDGIKIYMR